ncbi:MAG TPA: glycosyltransferase family 9 protein [Blastocatellia bacterium]|nr:glycosyltransferase family 9 protein [Blastocatellia bacterium]
MMDTSPDTARPEALVAEFLSEFRATGDYRRDCVARLTALATGDDSRAAEAATKVLFASLVERLADSFSPADVSLYNHVFAQVIEHCRRLGGGGAVDAALHRFGLRDEAALLGRAESLRRKRTIRRSRSAGVRRVVVLSRVTLGADVAITSVVISRLEHEFPGAEIVLVGGRKAAELFGGNRRVLFKEIHYRRAGRTLERVLSWLAVTEAAREMTAGLSPDEWLIVDTDSRLTQLGLLPLTEHEANYLFFPSREYGATTDRALGQLAAAWLDEVFDAPRPTLPGVSLRPADIQAASLLTKRLRQSGGRPLVTVNFGVGGNPAKRVSDEFEQSLVAQMIRDGATVILDKGAGADEARRGDAVIAYARREAGASVSELTESHFVETLNRMRDTRLVVWDGGVGRLAALIAQSDFYVGYDSAGQHIAAAAGTPGVTVFAGYSSPRMLDRWRPTGSAASHIIAVDPSRAVDAGEILSATLAALHHYANDHP